MTRETGISFSQMFLCYLNVPCEQRLLSFMAFSINNYMTDKPHERKKKAMEKRIPPLLLIGVLL